MLVVAVVVRGWIGRSFTAPQAQEWLTVFAAVVVQAMPFVVLGTLLSAAISTLVPEELFARVLPRRPALAVPVAGWLEVIGTHLPRTDPVNGEPIPYLAVTAARAIPAPKHPYES
jgi:uncharacterized membrane protein YraQ (UPF0718 family)